MVLTLGDFYSPNECNDNEDPETFHDAGCIHILVWCYRIYPLKYGIIVVTPANLLISHILPTYVCGYKFAFNKKDKEKVYSMNT